MQFVASRRSGGPLGPIVPWFLTGTSRRNPECPLGPAVTSRVLTGTFGQAQVLTRTCRPVRGEGKRGISPKSFAKPTGRQTDLTANFLTWFNGRFDAGFGRVVPVQRPPVYRYDGTELYRYNSVPLYRYKICIPV